MSSQSFRKVAATLFGFFALVHVARLALDVPVQVGATTVPMAVSWLGLAIGGALCAWGFRARP